MRKPIPVDEWLTDNKEKLRWTQNYLNNINFNNSIALQGLSHAETLAELLRYLKADSRTAPEKLRKIKSAWNQHTCKKDNKKRSYTFTMATNIEKRLEIIAKRKPVNQALESLINNVADFKKALHDEYKAKEKERAEEWQEKIRTFNSKKKSNFATPKLQDAREAIEEQQKFIDKLLMELCNNLVVLEDNNLTIIGLSPAQTDKAQKKFKAFKSLYSSPTESIHELMKIILKSDSKVKDVLARAPDEYPPKDDATKSN